MSQFMHLTSLPVSVCVTLQRLWKRLPKKEPKQSHPEASLGSLDYSLKGFWPFQKGHHEVLFSWKWQSISDPDTKAVTIVPVSYSGSWALGGSQALSGSLSHQKNSVPRANVLHLFHAALCFQLFTYTVSVVTSVFSSSSGFSLAALPTITIPFPAFWSTDRSSRFEGCLAGTHLLCEQLSLTASPSRLPARKAAHFLKTTSAPRCVLCAPLTATQPATINDELLMPWFSLEEKRQETNFLVWLGHRFPDPACLVLEGESDRALCNLFLWLRLLAQACFRCPCWPEISLKG